MKTYFPIAAAGKTQEHFLKLVRNYIPGLECSSDGLGIIDKLESFQYYHDANNLWLAHFQKLTGGDKHERFAVQQVEMATCLVTGPVQGRPVYEFHSNGGKFALQPGNIFIFVKDTPSGEVRVGVRFVFEETGEEVYTFLKRSIEGVKNIVDTLKPHIH